MSYADLTPQQKKDTEPWILTEPDKRAVEAGMWWDLESAAYNIWWIERFCKLYEGAGFAGKPLYIHGYHDQPEPVYIHDFYEDLDYTLDVFRARFEDYYAKRDDRDHVGWQLDFQARCYGWKMRSERWARQGIPKVRRFRSGTVFIPKKSGKSPTMAANVVYITCGDGEPGNKCFIGAGNQDQAGIAWKHAFLMIQQSSELKREFKPNMSTKRVEHLPSHSTFEPMSSANQRSQNAKEGLNGSCCLDEIHVLDDEFVSILRYMGVSRPEPLQLEFSTAGKNPEAYGATRWKYGERLNAGEEDNLHHLHISYNAPQNLSPEDLAEDPEKYIRMANPSLGHTVDMEELLPSYHSVKNDTRELRRYMMYRLNIFQNAASSWLDPGVWASCATKPFSENYLKERSCVIGLDLARRYDLACAVAAWLGDTEEDERPILIRPYFWCPEAIVRERASKIPDFLDWMDNGYIKATPGNVIDFRTIEKDLRELITKYDVRGMTYDATYAEDLVQRLLDGVVGPDGDFVYEPLPIGEKAVSQSILTMTGMTTDFENDLKSGRIQHEDHPVLTWQIGNASVKEDNKGNIQVVKENRDSFRTVDGVVAAIMGRWGLVDCDDFNITSLDFYVNNDVEFV